MKKEKTFEDRLLEDRTILINGNLPSELTSNIVLQLLTFSASDDKEEIQLFIGSCQGEYLDMMAIYDTIKGLKNPIKAYCVGAVSNYGVLLISAATKGKRLVLKHSRFYLSQPYAVLGTGSNQETEIALGAKEVLIERTVFEKALAIETKNSLETIHSDCEKGIDLTSLEAIKYGIIDRIIE